MSVDKTVIGQKLAEVQQRILASERRYDRELGATQLLAVSKGRSVASLKQAWVAGQMAFGENYLQEALPKIQALADLSIEWHFIGTVQLNKAKKIAKHFNWVHSVTNCRIAEQLAASRAPNQPPLNICIQVNISQQQSKSGISEDQLPPIAQACTQLPGLRLRGLMAIPAVTNNFFQQRAQFQKLKILWDELRRQGYSVDTLSMGMSADLEAAIAEGSTLVRVGTAIFGERKM